MFIIPLHSVRKLTYLMVQGYHSNEDFKRFRMKARTYRSEQSGVGSVISNAVACCHMCWCHVVNEDCVLSCELGELKCILSLCFTLVALILQALVPLGIDNCILELFHGNTKNNGIIAGVEEVC